MMQILDAVKSVIPDAANRPAGEVLEFVLGALRNCLENVHSSDGSLSRVRKCGHFPGWLEISPIIVFRTVERINDA
jgi:hypothetical protein